MNGDDVGCRRERFDGERRRVAFQHEAGGDEGEAGFGGDRNLDLVTGRRCASPEDGQFASGGVGVLGVEPDFVVGGGGRRRSMDRVRST